MLVNMLSNFGSKSLLSFQAVLSELENQKRFPFLHRLLAKCRFNLWRGQSEQNLKPDCCETRSAEWQKLMHFSN